MGLKLSFHLVMCLLLSVVANAQPNNSVSTNTNGSWPSSIQLHGPKQKVTNFTHEQALTKAEEGKLEPFEWYFITDKNVYIQAATQSFFMLEGFYVDMNLKEVDRIQFDFKNGHIQWRCDSRGNCVGANFDIINLEIISADPIKVFKWGDNRVQDNTVKNAILDLTGLKDQSYAVISNTVFDHAEVALSNADSLYFMKNTCSKGATWSAINVAGSIFDNTFSTGIMVNMDSAEIIASANDMFGGDKFFNIKKAKGKFAGNIGQGNISCIKCGPLSTIMSASMFDGASIYADSMNTQVNAVELHRGSELHMQRSDSAFSKSFLDFTAIVHAESNQNRSEYNRFVGCRNGYGTHFYASMTTQGLLSNSSFSSCETLILDSQGIYQMKVYEGRHTGINTIPVQMFEVKGGVVLDVTNAQMKLMGLQRFANDTEAKKAGVSIHHLYINSETGAVTVQQIP